VLLGLCLPWSGAAGCAPLKIAGASPFVVVGEAPPPPPAAPPPRVEITDDRILIREKIQFDYDRATIRAESFDLLAEIAAVIRDNPRLELIRIEGHASEEGADEYNLQLSKRRAKSVLDHLVGKGKVDPKRLLSEGYGETRPLEAGSTPEILEKNRRVEFVIVQQRVKRTRTTTDTSRGTSKKETEDVVVKEGE
jgi:OOP family OmpA-OmpF porin